MMDKIKALTLIFSVLALYHAILFYLLKLLNAWLHKTSLFGITYKGLDIRIIIIGFIFSIFGIWLLVECAKYLKLRELRRKEHDN